jgi:hypothetical protein
MAYPFGGSTASMGIWFTPRIRRFSHKINPQLLIIPLNEQASDGYYPQNLYQ